MQFPGPAHSPYADAWANALYNMLFCDRVEDFMARPGIAPTAWQQALCVTPPDLRAAGAIAADRGAEPRVRLLAFNVLRAHGAIASDRELLGTVIEVPLEGGLDTLAAYADGSVRYIHHSGRAEIVEASPVTRPIVERLLQAAARVVPCIGPWGKARPPAPPAGQVRLNFLVSDGLYFGQGPMEVMQRDTMAGPIIDHATGLLQTVIGLAHRHAA